MIDNYANFTGNCIDKPDDLCVNYDDTVHTNINAINIPAFKSV